MNEARIYSLGTEDTWPYLTTDLFALPRMEHTYNDQLIAFGTIFKNFGVTSGWPEWCAKFEALLRTMAWYEAHVLLDIEGQGNYHFTWKPVIPDVLAWDWEKPVEQWKFSSEFVGKVK